VNFDRFNNFRHVIISSLVTNLSSSTAQEIVNWITTADGDGCVHSADTTQLDFAVGKFVQTHRNLPTSCEFCIHRRRDSTELKINSNRCLLVGRWALPWSLAHCWWSLLIDTCVMITGSLHSDWLYMIWLIILLAHLSCFVCWYVRAAFSSQCLDGWLYYYCYDGHATLGCAGIANAVAIWSVRWIKIALVWKFVLVKVALYQIRFHQTWGSQPVFGLCSRGQSQNYWRYLSEIFNFSIFFHLNYAEMAKRI